MKLFILVAILICVSVTTATANPSYSLKSGVDPQMYENACKKVEDYKDIINLIPADFNQFGYLTCIRDIVRAVCVSLQGSGGLIPLPPTCKATIAQVIEMMNNRN